MSLSGGNQFTNHKIPSVASPLPRGGQTAYEMITLIKDSFIEVSVASTYTVVAKRACGSGLSMLRPVPEAFLADVEEVNASDSAYEILQGFMCLEYLAAKLEGESLPADSLS